MLRRSMVGLSLLVLVLVALHGCDGGTLPGMQLGTVPDQPATEQPILLEAEQVYPPQGPVGTQAIVYGRGHVFPAGFYRVVMAGGSRVELYLAAPTSSLTFTVPPGARSGPFGFVVGSRPDNGTTIGPASPDGFAVYTVKDPGFTVTGGDPWVP